MCQFLLLVYTITLCLIVRVVTAEIKLRITRNDYAHPGEFPYQVSLKQSGHHLCGGSLISEKHVLTAGHCVYNLITRGSPLSIVKVAVGTTTLPGGTMHDVQNIACHPRYSPKPLYADVAVVHLTTPVVESQTVQRIALPSPDFTLQPYHKFIASGFGASVFKGPTSPHLKKVKILAVPRQNCLQQWGAYVSNNDGLFCVTTPTRAGVCQGDSGGPLTIKKGVVVGIASAVSGHGCDTGIPDLFYEGDDVLRLYQIRDGPRIKFQICRKSRLL